MFCTIEIFQLVFINFYVNNFTRFFLLVILLQRIIPNQDSFNKSKIHFLINKNQKLAEAYQLLGITMHRLGMLNKAGEITYHRLVVTNQVLAAAKQHLGITYQVLAITRQC